MKQRMSRSRMRGLSLVEIMVSMAIGLVVVGAVLVSYISSGKTGRQQAAYAEMNENAQMGLTLLSRDLLLAGYAQPTGVPVPVAPAVATFTRTYSARAVFGCDNDFADPSILNVVADASSVTCKAAGAAGKPSIEIVYEADLTNTVPTDAQPPAVGDVPSDCMGNRLTISAGSYFAFNRYYLKSGTAGRSELHCASAAKDTTNQKIPGQPLVDNVEDIKFWYGVADAVNPRQIVRYLTAGAVTAAGVTTWERVVSVKICLLVQSSEPVLDSELTTTPKYLDCDLVEQNLPGRYLRRAYFTTTTLRNKMTF